MPKNIILCSDGTGNKGGHGDVTNVWRLFQEIDRHGHRDRKKNRKEQIAFHDDGVGTDDFKPLKIISGAFGWGLSENVRNLYLQLVRVYDPGDDIYLFGFSRGAYTVRVLAGLIVHCGVVDRWEADKQGNGRKIWTDKELNGLVEEAYEKYRATFEAKRGRNGKKVRMTVDANDFKENTGAKKSPQTSDKDVRIRFIGVWDTVDAVGLPVDELADIVNAIPLFRFRFPDKTLSPLVDKACHAISIDDERHTFHPVLWDEGEQKPTKWWRMDMLKQRLQDYLHMRSPDEAAPTSDSSDHATKRIEQVWFAGVHSNVGGGYPKQGMSLVALDWMMERAREHGLRFLDGALEDVRRRANVHDKLYDSRAGLAIYYRFKPRNIKTISRDNGITAPLIHYTVFNRIYMGTEGYAPAYIPLNFRIDVTDRDIRPRWQDEPHVKKIETLVKKRIGNKNYKKDFDQIHRQTETRRGLNFVIALSSLGLAWVVLRNASAFDNVSGVVDCLVGVGALIFSPLVELKSALISTWINQPLCAISLLAVLVAAYSVNLVLLTSTRKSLQRIWNEARADYDELFKKENSGEGAGAQ